MQWLEGRPASGLRRQHQFIRNATGWTETALGKSSGNGELGEHDELDGLSEAQVEAIMDKVCDGNSPADVQSEVNDQADAWKEIWGAGLVDKDEPTWPLDLGEIPPMIVAQALLAAANTFPKGTGLGWDGLHPIIQNRLSQGALLWICAVLHEAEKTGAWPKVAELVFIALLHKAEGGFRAIGLLPFLLRLWMRARKTIAADWEASHQKPHLYAGKKMGASVAKRLSLRSTTSGIAKLFLISSKLSIWSPAWFLSGKVGSSGTPSGSSAFP